MSHAGDVAAQLNLLGPVSLDVGGEPVRLSALERGVLARAGLGEVATGSTLVPWLWGEDAPSSSSNRIQALVSGIRRKCATVGVSPVRTEGSGYRLVGVRTDIADSRRDTEVAREASRAGSPSCLEAYASALGRFHEVPLQGIADTTSVEFERDRLAQLRLGLWEEYAEAAIGLGRAELVIGDLALLTATNPFHEGLLAQYLVSLATTGQQDQALRLYRETYERLADELGVAPSAVLQDAHTRVLQGSLTPGRRAHGAPTPAPEPTTATGLPVPRTLPRQASGFVGRVGELAVIDQAAVAAEESSVVVLLTGLTGMGKSALAIEGGRRIAERFPDGVLYADLARDRGKVEVGGVVSGFLRMLGIHPEAVPTDPSEQAALFRTVADGRRLLVVLDNVDSQHDAPEHLDWAIPAGAGSLTIVTSRGRLPDLGADHHVATGSLARDDARALLSRVLGAARVAADPAGADALIEALGGMPLAIRLVAGRLVQRPDLVLADVARRVGDLAHEDGGDLASLRVSLELILQRATPEARDLVGRLAELPTNTFSGWVPAALFGGPAGDRAMDQIVDAGFVEPVLAAGHSAQFRLHDVVARLAPQLDRSAASLERVGEHLLASALAQHRVHPSQFAPAPPVPGRAVTADGQVPEAARRASTTFFATENAFALAIADALLPTRADLAWQLLVAFSSVQHRAPEQGEWLAALRRVRDGLDQTEDGRLGAGRLAVSEAWFLETRRSASREARILADQARRQLTLLGDRRGAAAASIVAAHASLALGHRADAELDLERAAAALGESDDAVLSGWVSIVRGTLLNDYDELAEAARELIRARDLLATTPARAAFGQATLEFARVSRRRGQLGPANVLIDEALAHLEDDPHLYSYALDARAEVSVSLGHGTDALEYADRARQRAVESRDDFLAARSLRARAGALRLLGRLDEAEQDLRASVEQFTVINRPLSVAASLHELGLVLDLCGRHAEAGEAYRQERAARSSAQLLDEEELGTELPVE